MLVLSRRCGEKIIIGEREVEMTVLYYDEDKRQVKLGFEADKKIKINREEIYIKLENEQNLTSLSPELTTQDTSNTPPTEAANDASQEKKIETLTDERK